MIRPVDLNMLVARVRRAQEFGSQWRPRDILVLAGLVGICIVGWRLSDAVYTLASALTKQG